MVVSITPEDLKEYEKFGPLAGMYYQKKLEQMAFVAGGKTQAAPAQRMVDFVNGNYNTYRENAACPAVFEDMLGKFPYHTVFSPQDNPGIFGVHPSVWASLYRKSFLEENDIWFQ